VRINVLPTEIANMIAAGEVVERPASVVKELVENAIDAGATSITVEIKKGGVPYIRISDNGCGIPYDEVETAFRRHATSKIKTAIDLDAIGTLGFRGEALASIAAVARVEVFTKTKEHEIGRCVTIEGGNVLENEDAGCPDGTTMIVRNLFFNTPARMKFLKNDATETAYVSDVVNKLALSHPDIAFQYINGGKTVLSSSGDGKLISAIYAVFGKDYAKNMKEVHFEEDGFCVTGYVGNSRIARKDRRHQIFYVNSRNIMSKVMSAAVSEAYKSVVTTGHFPVCVLTVECDNSVVDVNVHPAKTEVRFADEKKVYHSVYWAVKNALAEEKYVPEIEIKNAPRGFDTVRNAPSYDGAKQMEINLLRESYIETKSVSDEPKAQEKAQIPSFDADEEKADTSRFCAKPPCVEEPKRDDGAKEEKQKEPLTDSAPKHTEPVPYSVREKKIPEGEERFAHTPKEEENKINEKLAQNITHVTFVSEEEERRLREPKPPRPVADVDFKYVGQVFGTYVIIQKDNEMLVIDQHAAHERLIYEELLEEFYESTIRGQLMLLPVTMTVSAAETVIAEEHKNLFESIGFDVEVFGANSLIIRSTPGTMEEQDIKDTVSQILTLISENRNNIIRQVFEEALHMIACKKALKGNTSLSEKELKALCEKVLWLGDGINTCPHGRPIVVKMTKYALERQFKREQ